MKALKTSFTSFNYTLRLLTIAPSLNKSFRKASVILHYYCSYCLQSIGADAIVCPNQSCSHSDGGCHRLSFIEVPIAPQIKRLLERKANYFQYNSSYESLLRSFLAWE